MPRLLRRGAPAPCDCAAAARGHRLDAITLELTFAVSFSEEGSNRRRHELRTQMHWRDLLQHLEGWQCCTLNRSVDAVETRCDTSIIITL